MQLLRFEVAVFVSRSRSFSMGISLVGCMVFAVAMPLVLLVAAGFSYVMIVGMIKTLEYLFPFLND